jgi:hypothetical protein
MCVTRFSLRRRELNTTVKRIKITEKDAEQVKAQKKQEITILSRPRAPILTKAARLIIHDPCSVSCLACCVVLEHVIFIEVNDDKLLKNQLHNSLQRRIEPMPSYYDRTSSPPTN